MMAGLGTNVLYDIYDTVTVEHTVGAVCHVSMLHCYEIIQLDE